MADPGTHPGGAFLPGAIPGVGDLPGDVVFSPNLPSTSLPSNPFATPLWEPSSAVSGLFPDPSAGFVEGLGAPQPATKTAASGGSSAGYVTGGNTALPGDIPQQGGDYGGLPPDQLGSGVAAGNDALQKIGAFAGNWIVRVGVIAAGVILIAAAAWNLAEERTA